MTVVAAETLAIKALTFLVNSPHALARFAAASGAGTLNFREGAEDPEFLAAVLDFIASEEDLARAFCAAEELKPDALHSARRALPGAAPDS